jgi:3-methyladenine DNA glycosylase AlkD
MGNGGTTRCEGILTKLRSWAEPRNVEGMARYGINPRNTLGVPVPKLRGLGKEIGKDHALAMQLWASGIHEARILAGIVADPRQTTEEQMERWVSDIDSWDVCDQCCMNLFDKTPFAYRKAIEWSAREEEFVRRAGFVLMARLAGSDRKAGDSEFERFLPVLVTGALDERNFVKKAVNWSLRQIGKRNSTMNARAIATAEDIGRLDSRSARWIASDALRELRSEAVQGRLRS